MGKSNHPNLGEFEELVLLAILWLQDHAYGVRIRQLLESQSGRTVSLGSVYTTLDRLESKGYVTSYFGEATAERGGKAKRFFRVEGGGSEALDQAMSIRSRLIAGIQPDFLPSMSLAISKILASNSILQSRYDLLIERLPARLAVR